MTVILKPARNHKPSPNRLSHKHHDRSWLSLWSLPQLVRQALCKSEPELGTLSAFVGVEVLFRCHADAFHSGAADAWRHGQDNPPA